MLSSYQLSERVNAQTLLWDSCGLIIAGIRKTVAVVGRVAAVVSHFLPLLLLALGLTLGIAVVAAAVAMIPLTFWLGLAITGALAYVGYPRPRKFGATCPRCGAILYEDGFCPRCRK